MNVFKVPVNRQPAQQSGDVVAAMLAHDLRGSLQGVLGGALLLERAEVDEELRSQIERIATASRTLDDLLGLMLGEEAEGQEKATRFIDVPDLLVYLRRRWTGEALERGVALEIEAKGAIPRHLRVARVALVRVLGNLIGNALKYSGTRASGRRVSVTVVDNGTGGIRFDVIDDGPGLDASALEAALRRGVRAAGTQMPIHGLGLHIVKELTERMGGSFGIESPVGGGLSACIEFPRAFCGQVDQPTRTTSDRPSLTGMRILLAEDNPTNQMVATQMLRSLDAEVSIARDGVEALEAFEAGEFDLLVVDIEMPRLSGLDVIRRIRRRGDARAAVPIVALTAYALREHRERIAEAGANGLISKPITGIEAFGRALLAHMDSAPAASVRGSLAGGKSDDVPVVDQETFDALRAAIGADMMVELLERVLADLAANRCALEASSAGPDQAQIRSASHILISVGGAIGATRLQAQAQKLNRAAHGENLDEVTGALAACLDEIDAALAFTESQRAR